MAEVVGVIMGPPVAAILLLILACRVARPWKIVLRILAAACAAVTTAVVSLIVYAVQTGLGGHLG